MFLSGTRHTPQLLSANLYPKFDQKQRVLPLPSSLIWLRKKSPMTLSLPRWKKTDAMLVDYQWPTQIGANLSRFYPPIWMIMIFSGQQMDKPNQCSALAALHGHSMMVHLWTLKSVPSEVVLALTGAVHSKPTHQSVNTTFQGFLPNANTIPYVLFFTLGYLWYCSRPLSWTGLKVFSDLWRVLG